MLRINKTWVKIFLAYKEIFLEVFPWSKRTVAMLLLQSGTLYMKQGEEAGNKQGNCVI